MYAEPLGRFARLSHCNSTFFTFPYLPNISYKCSLLTFRVSFSIFNVLDSGVGLLFLRGERLFLLGDLERERDEEREWERERDLDLDDLDLEDERDERE